MLIAILLSRLGGNGGETKHVQDCHSKLHVNDKSNSAVTLTYIKQETPNGSTYSELVEQQGSRHRGAAVSHRLPELSLSRVAAHWTNLEQTVYNHTHIHNHPARFHTLMPRYEQGHHRLCPWFAICWHCIRCIQCFDAVGWAAGRASDL